MNQLVTEAIVLTRTNYGEADRIIKLLTPEQGKISVLARGVRKPKSKLAGGIELFSISTLNYVKGRGSLGTLTSARLEAHYGNITTQIDRVQLGYELIKMLDRATEDEPEPEYFEILQRTFAALNDTSIPTALVRFWFHCQLLGQAGYQPNLSTDTNGQLLEIDKRYTFDFDAVSFADHPEGAFAADHIKFLRLTFSGNPPAGLARVGGGAELLQLVTPLVQTMITSYIRV